MKQNPLSSSPESPASHSLQGLMDKTILGWVKNVWYEDRLGRDFDHKEVTMKLGGFPEKRNEKYIKVLLMIYVQNTWGNVHCMISLMNI